MPLEPERLKVFPSKTPVFWLLFLIGTVVTRPAMADAISLQQLSLLQQFNLIDFGDLSTNSEIEGRAFVGGNEYGQLSNVGFNNGLTSSPAGYATLTVDGSVNGTVNVGVGNVSIGGSLNSANLNSSGGTVSQVGANVGNVNVNGGTLQFGGSKTGNVNANGGATVQKFSGLTPGIAASVFNPLTTLAGTLDRLAANSTVTVTSNTAIFNGVANANGQAVFDVTSAIFSAGQFQFNLNGATSALINVDGAISITSNANFLGGQAQSLAQKLLWNFNDLSTLNIRAEFGGTVLAPYAQVTNSASIDGTLVAASFIQSGELHSYTYVGSLPSNGTPVYAATVPEPPSLAVLAFGLLLVALLGLNFPGANQEIGFCQRSRQHGQG